MGYYASGDTRKIIQTSDDDEGYENQSSCTTVSVGILNQLEDRNKQYFIFGISQGISPTPTPPISDDTDRPFWAEDELSSSESKQQLNEKQKRRRSLSYRNRIAVHRSRSLLFQSSSSSLDSLSERISPGVFRREQFTKQFNIEQIGYSKTKKKYARKKGTSYLNNGKTICTKNKNINRK
ncbi:uncharacterized protein LOC114577322 [Apis cerana]|uniref:uncharacterized protein LOC114577322 n=1 Tax=Apis cerana TaxID=7461 RepID=UPI002B23452C|nr:uncharacterized protein LOC114577322 [Apis cerana]